MNIFKNVGKTLASSFLRFPALFLLGLCASALFILTLNNSGQIYAIIQDNAGNACLWGMLFAVAMQLALELKASRTIQLVGQALSVVLSFTAFYFILSSLGQHKYTVFFGGILTLASANGFLLSLHTKRFFSKALAAGLATLGIFLLTTMCATLILLAIITLIIQHSVSDYDKVFYSILILNSFFIAPLLFVSYAAKKDEDEYKSPAVFKTAILYVLFPFYVILLTILYIYIIETFLILQTFPVGRISPFVCIATALYIFFYFTLDEFDSKGTKVFYLIGSMILLPLIVVQCFAVAIRIRAFGLTPLRTASLYYIAFSVIFTVLPFIKRGKFMREIFLVFSIFCIFATMVPQTKITNLTVKNHESRIENVLKKYEMLGAQKVILKNTKEIASEDREILRNSYRAIYHEDIFPEWLLPAKKKTTLKDDFYTLFGFSVYYDEDFFATKTTPDYFIMSVDKFNYDLSGFSELESFYKNVSKDDGKIILNLFENDYDVTEQLLNLALAHANSNSNQEVLVLDVDDEIVLLIENATVAIQKSSETNITLDGGFTGIALRRAARK
ncbi:DUF4153 domain-containing protein [Treponema zioleckii]|uniref:DUF4153 domain-containing protein n=1 Tax=Treponema zioleckii TaxID=331680 RepID=UPI00168B7F2C|nr:DUF4153 domain-containing protein [Treponema zioleckii]